MHAAKLPSEPFVVSSITTDALLVQDGNEPHSSLNQVKHIRVVRKIYVFPGDPLLIIFVLDGLENVLGKLLLKLFVREINAELFESVDLE